MLKVTAAKLSDLCDLVNRRKEFLNCFGLFCELTKGHGSLLFKLGLCAIICQVRYHSSISAEILRIGRTSSTAADFVSRSRVILERMSKQGTDKARVLKSLVKMCNNHTNELLHIAGQSNTFDELIL